MKLKDYLLLLRRNVVLIVIATVVGGLGGLAANLFTPDSYSSRTELFISIATSGDPTEMQTASTFIQERIQTYVDMADSRSVLEPVVESQDLLMTPEKLSKHVNASSETGTVLVTVEASAGSPNAAADLSNAVAGSLVTTIEKLENPDGSKGPQLRLTVANPAVAPSGPDGPNWWMSAMMGVVLGFALGFGSILLRAAVDNRIRSKEDVENLTQIPVLASIPVDAQLKNGPIDVRRSSNGLGAEAFRRLRTNLQFAQIDDKNRAVLVTSALPGEGKTTASVNLAISLAQSGRKVALVDVDLRSPSVAALLGLENVAGLTTALVGEADLSELLQPWGQDELYVLTSGEVPPNPTELLDTRSMNRILSRLLEEFDTVILDAPPVLPVADSLVVAKQVGRVLVTSSVGGLNASDLTETLNSLGVVGVPLSLVLNKVPPSLSETSGYFRGYAESPVPTVQDDETGSDLEEHSVDNIPSSRETVNTQPISTVSADSASAETAGEAADSGSECHAELRDSTGSSAVPVSRGLVNTIFGTGSRNPNSGGFKESSSAKEFSRKQILATERRRS